MIINFKYFESLRDKMTPKSEEEIESKLTGHSPNELLMKGLRCGELWLVKKALMSGADINLSDNSPIIWACINQHTDIMSYLLDNGAEINKEVLRKITSFGYSVPTWITVHLRQYLNRSNESVRDMMTPKSSEEIEEKINRLDIKFAPFKEIIKVCSETYEFVSIQRISDRDLLYIFRANDLLYKIGCSQIIISTRGNHSYRMKLIVTEGRHRPERRMDINCIEDVLRIVNKGKEVMIGLNESVRDKMTGKSMDDVKKSIDKMLPNEKLMNIFRYKLEDQYTNQELNDMFDRTATMVSDILIGEYDYEDDDNAYQWALSHRVEIMELMGNGYILSDVVYKIMMGYERPVEDDWLFGDEDVNEGVRDMMTPKSEDEVSEYLMTLEPDSRLMFGIKENLPWAVEEAISDGADVNQFINIFGETLNDYFGSLLGYSVYLGYTEIVDMLLTSGAVVSDGCPEYKFMDFYIEDTPEMEEVFRKHNISYNKTNESVKDKMTPKSDDDIIGAKEKVIEYINHIVELNGGRIEIEELSYGPSAIVYKVIKGEVENIVHTVDVLHINDAEVLQSDKPETYIVKYIDMSPEILMGIKELLNEQVSEDGLLYESVRDKMTPKSEKDIDGKLDLLSQEQLNDRLVKSVTGNDLETLKFLLPRTEVDDSQMVDICELCLDLGHMKMLDFLLKNGVSKRVRLYLLMTMKDSDFKWNFDKQTDTKNESFEGSQKVTSVNDYKVVNYNENSPKRFQKSFSEFKTGCMNEGVRDMMTPKSKKEIMNSIRGMTFNSMVFSYMLRCAADKYEITAIEKYPSPMYQFSFCEGGNNYIVTTTLGANREWRTRLLVKLEPNTKHNKHNVRFNHIYDDITSFKDIEKVVKSYEDTNESVRDKMTPKSEEEIDNNIITSLNQFPELGTFDYRRWGWKFDYDYILAMRDDSYFFKNKYGRKIVLNLNGGSRVDLRLNAYNDMNKKSFNNFNELHNYLDTMNEGVRDMMTPKPIEEIRKKLKKKLSIIFKELMEDVIADDLTDSMDIGQAAYDYVSDEIRIGQIYEEGYDEKTDSGILILNPYIKEICDELLTVYFPEWTTSNKKSFWIGFQIDKEINYFG